MMFGNGDRVKIGLVGGLSMEVTMDHMDTAGAWAVDGKEKLVFVPYTAIVLIMATDEPEPKEAWRGAPGRG